MRATSKWIGCVLAGLIATYASAQVTPSGKGYLFRAKYVVGRSASYKVKSGATMQGMDVSLTMSLSEKTLSVNAGIGTIAVSTGKSEIIMNGKPFNQPTKVDNQKGVVKLDSLGQNADGSGVSLQTHLELPKQAIRIGDSWTTKGVATVPGQVSKQQVSVTYRFAGFDKVAGVRSVKLGVVMKGTGMAGVTGTGTAWIRADDCSLIREIASLNVSTQQMRIPASLLVTRN